MLAAWWLAVIGQPLSPLPLLEMPDQPLAVAVAASRLSSRAMCLNLICGDAEWDNPEALRIVTSARPVARPLPGQPLFPFRLSAPATSRDWLDSYASNWRVGAGYGLEAVRRPNTQVNIVFGTGYRIEPYVDDGIAGIGPVVRGRLDFSQRFGDRTRLSQQVQLESGLRDTFIRNAITFDVEVKPQVTIKSGVETRHDNAAGSPGRTETESSVKLLYAF